MKLQALQTFPNQALRLTQVSSSVDSASSSRLNRDQRAREIDRKYGQQLKEAQWWGTKAYNAKVRELGLNFGNYNGPSSGELGMKEWDAKLNSLQSGKIPWGDPPQPQENRTYSYFDRNLCDG